MMFPTGYRGLSTFRTFAEMSGLAHPLENVFSLYEEIQISKSETIHIKEPDDWLMLLGVTEEEVTGEQIQKALLRSRMIEATEDPHAFKAKEFWKLNAGLKANRTNGKLGGAKKHKKRTHEETKESTKEIKKELTEEPINRQRDEGSNELTKEGRNGLTNEGINERMNGRVTNGQSTGNPWVTHGNEPFVPTDWEKYSW